MPVASERMTLSLVSNHPSDGPPYLSEDRDFFPTNMLRNVAVNACAADRVLTVDVDFEFCCGTAIHQRLAQRVVNASHALVLPAFEARGQIRSRDQLLRAVESGNAIGFHRRQWPASHRCDDTLNWLKRGETAGTKSTRYTHLCEPYTVVDRRTSPSYDERFVGYGKNRVSFHYELEAQRVQLFLVPDVFVVHPMVSSSRHSMWWLGERCWTEFAQHVKDTYGYFKTSSAQRYLERDRRGCGMCSGSGLCLKECRPIRIEFRAQQTRTFAAHGEVWRSNHPGRSCQRHRRFRRSQHPPIEN